MAACSKCGAQVADGAAFCGNCGQPTSAVAVNSPVRAEGGTELNENVAGLLCYSLGWITGLIFFFIDKRPFVRFHAAQSIVVFGGLQIISVVLGWAFVSGVGAGGLGGSGLLGGVIGVIEFVLWIVLMIKAYNGQTYKVPIAAGIAEGLASK
jgi:uncharacterized membrane protein